MSNRRRRQVRDDDSDAESGDNSDPGSDNENAKSGSDAELPTYDEAVKLETDTKQSIASPNAQSASGRKQGAAPPERKNPAFVPRSDRFFLHDNREDEDGNQGSGNRGSIQGKG
jgi:hypothetical protein